jgi:hypothetical protein
MQVYLFLPKKKKILLQSVSREQFPTHPLHNNITICVFAVILNRQGRAVRLLLFRVWVRIQGCRCRKSV